MRFALLLALLAACKTDPGGNDDMAVSDLATADHAQGPLFCSANSCAANQYCVEECRGPQHCIAIPAPCDARDGGIIACDCLDTDPCRAVQPCFNVLPREKKVRCICE